MVSLPGQRVTSGSGLNLMSHEETITFYSVFVKYLCLSHDDTSNKPRVDYYSLCHLTCDRCE